MLLRRECEGGNATSEPIIESGDILKVVFLRGMKTIRVDIIGVNEARVTSEPFIPLPGGYLSCLKIFFIGKRDARMKTMVNE